MSIELIIGILEIILIATTPLVFAGIGELVTEKSGVLNLGVEGMMLVGAVTAFVTLVITGNYFFAFLISILSGVIMSGEVSKYSDSDRKLHLIHVGANDGKYHNFIPGTIEIGNSVPAVNKTVSLVIEDNKISETEQNTDFGTIGGGFLDFTENNPFGDPENN